MQTFGDLPAPYYWWENGALMGAMLDYAHYTNDTTYNEVLTTAISSQVIAPTYDLMVPAHYGDEGNDDQAFWAFTVLAAAERNFPQTADASVPSWLQVAENAFNTMSARWNTSACGGGLLWQIFPSNPNGLNYRNTVSNGGLFQMSARLYRATGNQTYLDWANKVWDWTTSVVSAFWPGCSKARPCRKRSRTLTLRRASLTRTITFTTAHSRPTTAL